VSEKEIECGPWIPTPGYCPIPDKVKHQVKLNMDVKERGVIYDDASTWRWNLDMGSGTISAYRVPLGNMLNLPKSDMAEYILEMRDGAPIG